MSLATATAFAPPVDDARPPAEEPVTQTDLGEFASDLLHGIFRLHVTHGPIAAINDGGQRVGHSNMIAIRSQSPAQQHARSPCSVAFRATPINVLV